VSESDKVMQRWSTHKNRDHGHYHNPPDPETCPICRMYRKDLDAALKREEWAKRQR
jgi:hypothetical protein